MPSKKGEGRVGVSVELYQPVDVLPHFGPVGMEDVGAVCMYMNAVDIFAVDVSAGVRPLVYHQTAFPGRFGLVREDTAEQTCPYDEVIVLLPRFHSFLFFILMC